MHRLVRSGRAGARTPVRILVLNHRLVLAEGGDVLANEALGFRPRGPRPRAVQREPRAATKNPGLPPTPSSGRRAPAAEENRLLPHQAPTKTKTRAAPPSRACGKTAQAPAPPAPRGALASAGRTRPRRGRPPARCRAANVCMYRRRGSVFVCTNGGAEMDAESERAAQGSRGERGWVLSRGR